MRIRYLFILIILLLSLSGVNALIFTSSDYISTNLSHYFNLDEIDGTVIVNLKNMSSNATAYNSPNLDIGKILNSINFNSSNNNSIRTNNILNASKDFTVSLWVKPKQYLQYLTNDNYYIFMTGANSPLNEFGLTYGSSSFCVGGKFILTGNLNANNICPTNNQSVNSWYHIVAVQDSTTNTRYLYINGTLEGTLSKAWAVPLNYSWIGESSLNSSYANATIDEIAIWNRALNSSEVLFLYNSGDGASYTTYSLYSSYNNSTYETQTESFTLTINISDPTSILNVIGNFYYNNTVYPVVGNCSSSSCVIIKTIDIPTISVINQNNTVYWNVTLYQGTLSTNILTPVSNQTVNRINMTQCTSGTKTLNYTSWDEETNNRIYNFSFDAVYNYYLGGGTSYKVLNLSSNSSEVNLCISNNLSYKIDSIIAYSDNRTGGYYPIRNYFTQGTVINNITQHIKLYSLLSSKSTNFVIQVQDKSIQPVKKVLVNAQKCFVGLASNESIFIHRTDSSGLTTGNLQANEALYQFFITNYSNTLLSVIPCAKVIPQTSPYTITFKLGDTYVSPFLSSDDAFITSSIYYNKSSQNVKFTYSDTSGNFTLSTLIVTNMNYTGSYKPVVCSNNYSVSSGVISCNITSAGTYLAQGYIYRTDGILQEQLTFKVDTVSSTLGYYGVFLGFIIILVCSSMFFWDDKVGIWMLFAACVFNDLVGFINFGTVWLTAQFFVSMLYTGSVE